MENADIITYLNEYAHKSVHEHMKNMEWECDTPRMLHQLRM